MSNGIDEVARVFEFLDLRLEESQVSEVYERFSFKKLKANQYERDVLLNPGVASASGTAKRPEPRGSFRKGVAGDWKNYLYNTQLREIYWVAGNTFLRRLP